MEFLADLHPKIVHFPMAFLMVYPFMELIAIITKKDFFIRTAFIFLLIGVVGAVLAVLTGNQAFIAISQMNDKTLELFNKHEFYTNLTTWFFTALLFVRFYLPAKKRLTQNLHLLILIVAIIGMYFVYQAGNYGGMLAENKIYDLLKEINTSE